MAPARPPSTVCGMPSGFRARRRSACWGYTSTDTIVITTTTAGIEWSDEIPADSPRKPTGNLYDQCGARCPDLPKVV
jgi:hypothetical protein